MQGCGSCPLQSAFRFCSLRPRLQPPVSSTSAFEPDSAGACRFEGDDALLQNAHAVGRLVSAFVQRHSMLDPTLLASSPTSPEPGLGHQRTALPSSAAVVIAPNPEGAPEVVAVPREPHEGRGEAPGVDGGLSPAGERAQSDDGSRQPQPLESVASTAAGSTSGRAAAPSSTGTLASTAAGPRSSRAAPPSSAGIQDAAHGTSDLAWAYVGQEYASLSPQVAELDVDRGPGAGSDLDSIRSSYSGMSDDIEASRMHSFGSQVGVRAEHGSLHLGLGAGGSEDGATGEAARATDVRSTIEGLSASMIDARTTAVGSQLYAADDSTAMSSPRSATAGSALRETPPPAPTVPLPAAGGSSSDLYDSETLGSPSSLSESSSAGDHEEQPAALRSQGSGSEYSEAGSGMSQTASAAASPYQTCVPGSQVGTSVHTEDSRPSCTSASVPAPERRASAATEHAEVHDTPLATDSFSGGPSVSQRGAAVAFEEGQRRESATERALSMFSSANMTAAVASALDHLVGDVAASPEVVSTETTPGAAAREACPEEAATGAMGVASLAGTTPVAVAARDSALGAGPDTAVAAASASAPGTDEGNAEHVPDAARVAADQAEVHPAFGKLSALEHPVQEAELKVAAVGASSNKPNVETAVENPSVEAAGAEANMEAGMEEPNMEAAVEEQAVQGRSAEESAATDANSAALAKQVEELDAHKAETMTEELAPAEADIRMDDAESDMPTLVIQNTGGSWARSTASSVHMPRASSAAASAHAMHVPRASSATASVAAAVRQITADVAADAAALDTMRSPRADAAELGTGADEAAQHCCIEHQGALGASLDDDLGETSPSQLGVNADGDSVAGRISKVGLDTQNELSSGRASHGLGVNADGDTDAGRISTVGWDTHNDLKQSSGCLLYTSPSPRD